MLFPKKKVKHRKWQRDRAYGARLLRPDTRGTVVSFGSFGVKATSQARVRSNQIEAARRNTFARTRKEWTDLDSHFFPIDRLHKKAAEVGMGKEKAI